MVLAIVVSYTSEEFSKRLTSYSRTKLYNILFTCELARQLEGTQVTESNPTRP
jgi:hypothetical protein